MAIKDNKSNQKVNLLHNATIATDTDTNSASIDTADYDYGVMLAIMATAYTDGDYALSLEESANNSDWVAVPSEKLIGAPPSVGALTSASGGLVGTLGVISNERYVRAVITSTSTTSGADIVVQSIMSGEYNPQ